MANFGPKPWVNPSEKISIFGLFELLVFIAQKGVLPFQNIVKHLFLAYIAFKKKIGKCHFSIFRLLDFLFLQRTKAFFVLQHRKTHFPRLYCQKNRQIKGQIWNKTIRQPLWKNLNFPTFLPSFFQRRKAFFLFQNIVKHIFLAYIA